MTSETYRDLYNNAQQLTVIAREMHRTGIPVDQDKREEHRVRLTVERDNAADAFRKHTSYEGILPEDETSISSNKALNKLFFTKYQVKPTKFAENTGAPTLDKGVLRDLLAHPFADVRIAAQLLLSFRQAATTESRYIGRGFSNEPGAYGLPVLRSTGRHHPTFGVVATTTLRFTCKGGAHQIQKDQFADKEGKIVITRKGARDIFKAPPGWIWIESDYMALELRLYALYAGLELWLEEFRKPKGDVHKLNAAYMLGKLAAEVNKQERDITKTCTFGGIAYGGKAATVWAQVVNKYPKITVGMIEEFQHRLFKKIPDIPRYQNEAVAEAHRLGQTPLASGDRIYWKFPGMLDESGHDTLTGEPKKTEVLNMRMQRTGARIINDAMPRVHARLDPKKCLLVLQLHDALHALCREDAIDESMLVFKEEMERELSWNGRRVWLGVDQKWGPNWGSLKDWSK